MCVKHNKQSPKILVTHMNVANTTSASEKTKILTTRTHMAESKHTEITQNLLIKEQPRKVKKKKQTQNPTQTKLI